MAKGINDGALIKYGWRHAKAKLGFFIGFALLGLLIMVSPFIASSILVSVLGESYVGIIMFLAFIAHIVLMVIVSIGFIKLTLHVVDKKPISMKLLVNGWDVFFKFIGVMVLYVLIVSVGFILLVIPGVIWGLKYMWAPWLVVDKGLSPTEALRRSDEMTMGLKWDLLGFHYVTKAVNFLGAIALYIGLFVTFPTIMLATAKLYRQHS